MSRLKRKFRTDIKFKQQGVLFDALDDAIKETWRINDEEYDFICEQDNQQVINYLVTDMSTMNYSEKRRGLITINRLVQKYHLIQLSKEQ